MRNLAEALEAIEKNNDTINTLKESIKITMTLSIPKPFKDEQQELLEKQIKALKSVTKEILQDLIDFPPHKVNHFEKFPDFLESGPFDKSVFIMTKFPNNQNPNAVDNELQKVIQTVRNAISDNGFIPRIALDKKYHPGLWDNVEMYLLGCKRGVAIVENKYQNELNPNVTMEWGWMKGMNRDVLFLVENTFDKQRADLSGLIQDQFDWQNPENGINGAIKNWLSG